MVAGPLFVGVSAPQGSGKTTVTAALCRLFADTHTSEVSNTRDVKNPKNQVVVAAAATAATAAATTTTACGNSLSDTKAQSSNKKKEEHACGTASSHCYNCIAISLDDFYHTYEHQKLVAQHHAQNPLLLYRGNAGTHDLPLLYETLHQLSLLPNSTEKHRPKDATSSSNSNSNSNSTSNSNGSNVSLPRYNKAAHNGRGDRFDVVSGKWDTATAPLDIVLIEGWMLGFDASTSTGMTTNNIASTN